MVLLFVTVISVIGGRAVPAFTRSWLQHAAATRQVRDWPMLSILALGATVLGGSLAVTGQEAAAGVCLLLAGAVQCVRLVGWQTLHARHYPAPVSYTHLDVSKRQTIF